MDGQAVEARFKRRISAAQSTMDRLQRAIEAGWDPEGLTDQYNAAVAEKRAAEAGLAAIEPLPKLTAADVRAMIAHLGDMTKALGRANSEDLAQLYQALALSISYDHRMRVAEVSITPATHRVSTCVRGGTRTLTTRLSFNV